MDNQKREAMALWSTRSIPVAGPLRIEDNNAGETLLRLMGEPAILQIESAGIPLVAIDSESQFQIITAALLYERAQTMMASAAELMRRARSPKE